MIRPSFVPPPEIRRLRDVTRYADIRIMPMSGLNALVVAAPTVAKSA